MSKLLYYSAVDSPAGSGFSTLADWQSGWAWCEWAGLLIYEVQWEALGSPSGTLALEGNNQMTTVGNSPNSAFTMPIPAPAGSPGTYGAWPTVPGLAVAGNATIVVANPMRWHRLTYTFLAGGNAGNTFQVHRTMRAP